MYQLYTQVIVRTPDGPIEGKIWGKPVARTTKPIHYDVMTAEGIIHNWPECHVISDTKQ